MDLSLVRILGMDTKHITEEEIMELVETANFVGEQPDGFVRLVHKVKGNVGNGKGYYGFQGIQVRATSNNGVVSVTAQMITDGRGNPSGSLKLEFNMNKLGVNYSYLPLSKHNLAMLIKSAATDKGAHWIIKDREIAKQVEKEAAKIKKARDEKKAKAFEAAEQKIHREKAATIKALSETYGEDAFREMKEYKESILIEVEAEAKRIFFELK